MRPWLPTYEGDGYLRQTDIAIALPARQDTAPAPIETLSPRLIERHAHELRHAALRNLAAGLLQRARNWLGEAPAVEAERYLAQATDLADLERRLIDAERRGLLCGRL